MEEGYTPEEIKIKINTLLWQILPPETTLKDAEILACQIYHQCDNFMAILKAEKL